MRATTFTDPAAFLEAAAPYLDAWPLQANVIGSVSDAVAAGRMRYENPRWFVVHDGGDPVSVAMHTPPWPVGVAPAPAEAWPALAAAVRDAIGDDLPGINGDRDSAEAFARSWRELGGAQATERQAMRAFALEQVIDAPPTDGQARRARADDIDVVLDWYRAFAAEAGVPDLVTRERMLGSITDGLIELWEVDGTPVTVAGRRPAARAIGRVGPVYTPPEHRRRGYATALTAAISRAGLADGCERMMLFTDLANPVSNAIYPKVGYRAVYDAVVLDLPST